MTAMQPADLDADRIGWAGCLFSLRSGLNSR